MEKETTDRIIKAVQKTVGTGYTVQYKEVLKNNGIVWKGCLIQRDGEDAASVVYINNVLKEVELGKFSVTKAAEKIVHDYYEHARGRAFTKVDLIMDKKKILENVIYYVVNKEKNTEYLIDKPFRDFLDLAVTYRVIVVQGEEEIGSMPVTDGVCEVSDISPEELESAARQNAEAEGFRMQLLTKVLAELLGTTEVQGDEAAMWVCINKTRLYGACAILCNQCFCGFADEIGDDLVVFPSSIHELIVVPAGAVSGIPLRSMQDMVKQINSCEVPANEVLSDSVYLYSRKTKEISILQEGG